VHLWYVSKSVSKIYGRWFVPTSAIPWRNPCQGMHIPLCSVTGRGNEIKQIKIRFPRTDCSLASRDPISTTYVFAYTVRNAISSLSPTPYKNEKYSALWKGCEHSVNKHSHISPNMKHTGPVKIFTNHQTQVLITRTTTNLIWLAPVFQEMFCGSSSIYSTSLQWKLVI